MEKYEIVGKEEVDYVSKKTNERVEGLKLHCIGEVDAKTRVKGIAVETLWISKRSEMYADAVKVPMNTAITCNYNRWGGLEGFSVINNG